MTLFSEQSRTATAYLNSKEPAPRPKTVLMRLKEIWEQVLPHRRLYHDDMKIMVSSADQPDVFYPGSEMSDGERLVFYMLGQCLLAPEDGVIVIDEPEVHVHKAILKTLWDHVEAARPDCCFVYISHDLDFVATRPGARKYIVSSYRKEPQAWEMEALPSDTDLPERVVSEILGSRRPVLFTEGAEGNESGLDALIYRAVYPDFLIYRSGGCADVIHAVSTFRRNATLHRLGRVHGLIDSDGRGEAETAHLRELSVFVTPVAEIENVFLIREVFLCLCSLCHFDAEKAEQEYQGLADEIVAYVGKGREAACARYVGRVLDRQMKSLIRKKKTVDKIKEEWNRISDSVDVDQISGEYFQKLDGYTEARDLRGIAEIYDDKGMLDLVGRRLGQKNRDALMDMIGRVLLQETGRDLLTALREVFPVISD
ncbi:AAA family ATPase [Acetobacter sp. AN02]|nr:AAA family ATPase [Acetobacter sp. AN02]